MFVHSSYFNCFLSVIFFVLPNPGTGYFIFFGFPLKHFHHSTKEVVFAELLAEENPLNSVPDLDKGVNPRLTRKDSGIFMGLICVGNLMQIKIKMWLCRFKCADCGASGDVCALLSGVPFSSLWWLTLHWSIKMHPPTPPTPWILSATSLLYQLLSLCCFVHGIKDINLSLHAFAPCASLTGRA